MAEQVAPEGVFVITEDIFATVAKYRGKYRVDVRKWYLDKDTNEMARTRKGINMTMEEWNDFFAQIEELNEYVQNNSENRKEKPKVELIKKEDVA